MLDTCREAARSLRRDRAFAVLAVALMAVTLGVTTAVYAIVHAVVLQPLPFDDQDRVAVIWQRDLRRAQPVIEVAYGEVSDWRRRSRSFDDLAVVGSVNWSLTLAGRSEPERLSLSAVSAAFFRVLGTPPLLGRGLHAEDEQGTVPRAAVLSHRLWVRRFGADTGIVGRTLLTRQHDDSPALPITVAGVMPAAFDFPRGTEIWLPAAPLVRSAGSAFNTDAEGAVRWLRVFYGIGRLRSGVSPDEAARELTQVIRTTDVKGGPPPPERAIVTPIAEYLLGPSGPALRAVFAGAALMLFIACANVGGLQLSRAARRQRALAIRAAVGASPLDLVRLTLVESLLLTAAALAGAVAIAAAATRLLTWLAPAGVPRLDEVTLLDPRVFGFGAAAAFGSLVVCSLWPSLATARVDVSRALAQGARAGLDARGRRGQRVFVVAQVALSLTLLAGTALFVRTIRALDRTTLGFDPAGLLAITVNPGTSDPERRRAFYDALEARVAALPHVTAVGSVYLRPLSGPIGLDNQPFLPGQVAEDAGTWGLNPHVNLETVTPGYFDAMRIRVVRGRGFTDRDTASAPGVVIVSESAARRLWPGLDPIGQRLRDMSYRVPPGAPQTAWQTVVGVVEDVRYRGLTDVRLDLYLPAAQSTHSVEYLMVRAEGPTAAIVPAIRAAARALDSAASVSEATVMSEVVAAESAPWRYLVQVFVAFAAAAACLAAVGLGAVVVLMVATRRRELAIRAALGADPARLRRLAARDGLWLVASGCALGLAGALALGRSVASLLLGIPPHDGVALGAATATAAVVGWLACWLPAKRAADVDPLEALRSE